MPACLAKVKTKFPACPMAGATKESAKSKAPMPCLMTTLLGGDMPPAPLLLCPPGVCASASALPPPSSACPPPPFPSCSPLPPFCSSPGSRPPFSSSPVFCCFVVASCFLFLLSVFHCCLFIIVPSPSPRPWCLLFLHLLLALLNKGLTQWPLV